MKGKLIIDGTAVYELDEECMQNKECQPCEQSEEKQMSLKEKERA